MPPTAPPPGGSDPARFEQAPLRLLLARLSPERTVGASVTHRALLGSARRLPGLFVDVAFRPPSGSGGWRGAWCGRSAAEFDLVGITLSVVQEALNLPPLLRDSGLPLGRAARAAARPELPLVLLGGHSAAAAPFLHGPLPDGDAGLVDAVLLGDGLEAIREIAERLAQDRAAGRSRAERLERLGREVEGFHRPDAPDRSAVRRRTDPPEAWLGYDGGYLPWSDAAGEETLPVAAGCPHRCRFCRDGWSGPYRALPLDAALEVAARLKASLAAHDLNLLAPDLGCRRDLPTLFARLLDLYPRLSAKSLAGISLLRTPDLLALLPRLGKREITVGVEGASRRWRRWFGKRFDPEALVDRVEPLARAGLRQVKLFYIATGRETAPDEAELLGFLRRLAAAGPRVRRLVSVMPLFPAPGTPLELAPAPTPAGDLAGPFRRAAEATGAEWRWSAEPTEIRAATLLLRAGPRATSPLVRAALEHRVAYDDGLAPHHAARIESLLAAHGLDIEALARPWPPDAPLPWDPLDLGTPRHRLRAEALAAAAALDDPADPGPPPAVPESPPADPSAGTGPATTLPPSPFARTVERTLIFRTAPEAAGGPAATAARGALREWFLRDAEAARAYAGLGEVRAVPGTAGLAAARVAAAEGRRFHLAEPVTRLPTAPGVPAVPLALLDPPPERCWFRVELPGGERTFEALRGALGALRPAPRFRVDRVEGERRLVVDPGFRGRCGVAALRLGVETCRAFLSPELPLRLSERLPPGAVAVALFLPGASRCPRCRGPRLSQHFPTPDRADPVCPACDDPPAERPPG